MDINSIIRIAFNNKCSDIHISENMPLMFRINGSLMLAEEQPNEDEISSMIASLMDKTHKEVFSKGKDVDFAYQTNDGYRLRVNVFRYSKGIAASFKTIK